jgi:hypothetical protein
MKSNLAPISGLQTATGPRTVEGKRRSSKNAIKHGIFSKHLFLEDECRADFDNLHRDLCEDFQPKGVMEGLLVEQLAILFLRWRLILTAESAMIARSPASELESINGEKGRLKEDLEQIELASKNFSHFSPRTPLLPSLAELDLIVRYESHLIRVFDRKLSQLQGLQRARRCGPPTPAIKIDFD